MTHLTASERRDATDYGKTLLSGPQFRRVIAVGQHWVVVALIARHSDGRPVWHIAWEPATPSRLTLATIRQFDAGVARCKAELLAEMAPAAAQTA
jgi:hypothetical protein